MIVVVTLYTAVITQFGAPLAGDMEMNVVAVEKIENVVDRRWRKVMRKCFLIIVYLLRRHKR